jgi:WD40 repeat protein
MVEGTTAPRFKYYQADLTFGQKKFEGITPAVSNDTDGIDCNDKFIALPWSRTSTVAVFPAYDFKRFETNLPLIQGHKGNINDVQFSHFNPNLMATASEDGMIKLWLIPDEGIKTNVAESDGDLAGHTKKVTGLRWHRTADNLIASHSADSTVRIWDVMN